MPQDLAQDPLDLRHRAEEARVKAEATRDPGARQTFLDVADTYARLADHVERSLRLLSSKPKSSA